MGKYRHDRIPAIRLYLEVCKVRDLCLDYDASRLSKPPRLLQADRRRINRNDIVPVLGQEHGIAPLPLGDTQCPAAGNVRNYTREKVVWLNAVYIFACIVSFVPHSSPLQHPGILPGIVRCTRITTFISFYRNKTETTPVYKAL
jgi:hypothetical protein